ncbi:hypothetical protein TREMEDRAFT_17955, partial [Tremella mesenterica DSM 1558]|uniref:uncharacterized protein n=1 Tax=Tremella mesenterica (strain ATCC 24925 / CBS 8224 / DSM 1558 / NBRC 9311 / NRRL Y-6157 / RJB 2259-6 / UBC 559-6) TaxID=578456 RepID=UPI0003F48D1C
SYPHLTRAILPTYKGRVLAREEDESGERYIDKAAVFVGRLVKSQENDQSLFQRFSKYGRICGIEYNPKVAQSTYATARILFADEDAALQAIEHEQGGVSFGSAIKVEVRRVLPMDVHVSN